MPLTRQRGRPRQERPEIDLGTPELRARRARDLTIEPLDWLRREDYISEQLHWCAMHFRWLFTLRYGTVTPQSLDAARARGVLHRREYTEWEQEREAEWLAAMERLEAEQLQAITLKYCIYEQILPLHWRRQQPMAEREIERLKRALTRLEALWCKSSRLPGRQRKHAR